MRIGRYEITSDGGGWKVENAEVSGMAKTYPTLAVVMMNLPQEEAALLWPICEDMAEMRERFQEAAETFLENFKVECESCVKTDTDLSQVPSWLAKLSAHPSYYVPKKNTP